MCPLVVMSEAQRERLVANERIFRGENRTILEDTREEGAVPIGRLISFYCECSQLECLSRLLLSAREYEQIHADARRFCVIAGHEDPRVERVIAETQRYAVVQKLG